MLVLRIFRSQSFYFKEIVLFVPKSFQLIINKILSPPPPKKKRQILKFELNSQLNKLLLTSENLHFVSIFRGDFLGPRLWKLHRIHSLKPSVTQENFSRKSSFLLRYKRMDIETRILTMSIRRTVTKTTLTECSNSLTKFYCFNIQRELYQPKKEVWL